jgi:hypothetical protein
VRVVLGGNNLINCPTLLAYRGAPLLRVLFNPFRLELNVPPDLPGAPNPVALRHVTTERSDAVFAGGDQAVAIATLLDPASDSAHLHLDLRPLGINIYDDLTGLHVGNNLFAGNVVEGAAVAINLG